MRFFAFIAVLWMLGLPGAWAQEAATLVRQHRYTDALAAAGDDLDALDPATLTAVAVAHLRRGRLLLDLAALQSDIAAAYYTRRLSETSGPAAPWIAYFLGRHLLAQARPDAARRHFKTAAADTRLPAAYRRHARANADLFACIEAGTPLAARRCRLAEAVRAADAGALPPLQRALLAADLPDQEVLRGNLPLRFYDPATLRLLAAADFTRAMEAFRRLGTADGLLFAGVSAFEAGHEVRAQAWLGQSKHPLRHVYLAALALQQDDAEAAATHSTEARRAAADIVAEWVWVMSRFPGQHAAVRRAAQRLAAGTPRNARLVGGGLLRAGRPAEALRRLEAAYPFQHHHDLAYIEPGFLATLAHARYRAGRAFFPAMRSDLATLAEAYPVAAGVLYLAQAHTAPERLVSFNKRTGE